MALGILPAHGASYREPTRRRRGEVKTREPERRGMVGLGATLLVLGVLALAGRSIGFDAFDLGWPLFVVVPGPMMFAAAVSAGGRQGSAIAVPAGIITMTDLVLAFQNATDLWATWAYAWALVAPGGVGVGLSAYGFLTGQREFLRAGMPILAIGLALFLGFGILFEGVIGLNRTAIVGAETLLAGGLVVLGIVLVVGGLLGRRSES
jgi:hypothetical protein